MTKLGHLSCSLALCSALLGCQAQAPRADGDAAAHLEVGNAQYAAGDHAAALAHYRAAAESDSTNAAAWYGIHMAGSALGDTALAAAALARVRRLTPESGLSEHPRPRPPGHPPIDPARTEY